MRTVDHDSGTVQFTLLNPPAELPVIMAAGFVLSRAEVILLQVEVEDILWLMEWELLC